MKAVLLVGLGGAIGSILRYGVALLLKSWSTSLFPWATFCVNLIGCLLIGTLMGYMQKHTVPSYFQWFFVTGFCGGFTTFSTFSQENFQLLQQGEIGLCAAYILGSITLGIAGVFVGYYLSQ